MPVILCGATVTSGSPPITLVCGQKHKHPGKHKAVSGRKTYRW